MRVAITSQNFRTVTSHAGRARRFLLVDTGLQSVEARRLDLDPEFAMHGFDDAAPHPLDGVDVLITGSAGEGLTRRLARRGIRVVCTAETEPTRAVEDFLNGCLKPAPPHEHGDCAH
jgi:predicted Fe-Mo cluster-binding NifX family protein